MKITSVVFALAAGASSVAAQAAPRVTEALPAAELSSLEALRKQVWVSWFSGDTAMLKTVLPPELVALSNGAPHWQSLDESIASSAEFKAGGGRLVSITFDSTMTHRFGETVVMFSHYALVTERAGTRSTQKGRATEVFVRNGGRWVHTSWHLDALP